MSIFDRLVDAGMGEHGDIFDRYFTAFFEMQPVAFFVQKTINKFRAVAQLDIDFLVFLRRIMTGGAFLCHAR